jgi:hypothetical protein
MPDVTVSKRCSSFEAGSGNCVLSGRPCPFANNQRECPDCSFVAHVTMAPDEFHVLVDAEHRPTRGTLPIRRFRTVEINQNVAGAHVNLILDCAAGDELLDVSFQADGRIHYHCRKSEAALAWRDGKFTPVW